MNRRAFSWKLALTPYHFSPTHNRLWYLCSTFIDQGCQPGSPYLDFIHVTNRGADGLGIMWFLWVRDPASVWQKAAPFFMLLHLYPGPNLAAELRKNFLETALTKYLGICQTNLTVQSSDQRQVEDKSSHLLTQTCFFRKTAINTFPKDRQKLPRWRLWFGDF